MCNINYEKTKVTCQLDIHIYSRLLIRPPTDLIKFRQLADQNETETVDLSSCVRFQVNVILSTSSSHYTTDMHEL